MEGSFIKFQLKMGKEKRGNTPPPQGLLFAPGREGFARANKMIGESQEGRERRGSKRNPTEETEVR